MPTADPKSLHKLLDAVVDIGSGLDLSSMLQRITELAAELVDARYAALGVLDEAGTGLSAFITAGMDDEARERIGSPPKGRGILGLLITDSRPIRLTDLGDHPDSAGFPPGHPSMRSFLGVPISVRGQVFGNLYLTEKAGGVPFDEVDEELIVGLAAAAGVAVENARLHETVARLLLFEDRERIARDLHDNVIQRLFATGLSLQSTVSLIPQTPDAAHRLESAVGELDETIRQIRAAIFSLEQQRTMSVGLSGRVRKLCREAVGALGFEPSLEVVGDVDSVGGELAADLLATLREALSNVARHARADHVWVRLDVEGSRVALQVTDDGIGPSELRSDRGRGLRNMAARAERHGGRCEIGPGPPSGAVLRWSVPRSPGI